jgi:hypothetical protein
MARFVTRRAAKQASDPIVIFGAPRSGTSYLNRLINQHPAVYVSEEARLFLWAHYSLNELAEDRRLVRKHRDQFNDHLRACYPDLIRSFYRELRPHARYWGDKNPEYAAAHHEGCLETIIGLFPGARFIHIIRDGRDVVTSIVRKGWNGFEDAHRNWTTHVDIGSRFGARFPYAYLELRYEELVRDDTATAQRIFDFLGIEIHRGVLSFAQKQQQDRTWVKRPTRDVALGIASSEWQHFFAPDQQLSTLQLIGDHLIRLGYETDASLRASKEKLSEQDALTELDPIREIVRRAVPANATVVVMSNGDNRLLSAMDGRRAWHFPQREGGHNIPLDLDAAGSDVVSGLERLHANGGGFLLVPSSAFPRLEERTDLRRHLESRYRSIWADDHCRIFELVERRNEAPVD